MPHRFIGVEAVAALVHIAEASNCVADGELAKAKDGKKGVLVASLAVDRVPVKEWAQIFDEVWRRYRDFFYVENLHGYDWQALRPLSTASRARCAPLRPELRHWRDDRRIERRPRLHHWRRLGRSTPSPGRTGGGRV